MPDPQVSNLLAELGNTPDGVAEVLQLSECRGHRYGYFPSPIIRFAYRRFDAGRLELVYTSPDKPGTLYLFTPDGIREDIPLPTAVADFLALFDAGAYSDLDLATVRTSA
jgi:hypothetical protein